MLVALGRKPAFEEKKAAPAPAAGTTTTHKPNLSSTSIKPNAPTQAHSLLDMLRPPNPSLPNLRVSLYPWCCVP